MKICVLIPVYMTNNSREVNLANLRKLKETEFTYVDEVVICDQCFQSTDYIEGFTYLGPYGKLNGGSAEARNILFRWFYNSDYDYALLMDARENVSKSGYNSFVTLCNAIHNNQINQDVIQGTVGQIVSAERILDKQMEDYHETVNIRYVKNPSYIGLHHIFISNFKKKYNKEIYIDVNEVSSSGCLTSSPLFEDQYFQYLCGKYFNCYLIGDMMINLGPQKASIWAPNGGESARNTNWKKKAENLFSGLFIIKPICEAIIRIPRDEEGKDLLTEYKPRVKQKDDDFVPLV